MQADTHKKSQLRPLVVIVGPTASGKSALAMRVARAHAGEIIAADSRTVYRGMDIGTAKPSAAEREQIPHHLLDIRDPDEAFSAADFKSLALVAIDNIGSRGKLPILVGGSGLYVDSIIFDYSFGPVAEPGLRAKLQSMTITQLQDTCREKNIALPINNHNKRHLIRAIEMGGLINHQKTLRPSTIVVGLSAKKETLRMRIEQRARQMFASGVLDEARALGESYGWRCEALTGNIYRVLRNVLAGTVALDNAIEQVVKSDLALAKRQMTWFRRNPNIVWSEDPAELEGIVDTFLRHKT